MSLMARLRAVQARGERAVLLTVVEGRPLGAKLLVLDGGEAHGEGPPELAELGDELIRGARNRLLDLGGRRVFAEVYAPPPRLLLYGAVDTAQALCRAAKLVGWTTIVGDARAAFATPERIPSADRLLVGWPAQVLDEVRPDHGTAVVVLIHDAKFDVPLLAAALRTEAFYVGVLGSRRRQESVRRRLQEAGVAEGELERLAGPCGLDLGAETQDETAISILGEILALRAGRSGGRLRDAPGPIHAPADEPVPAP